MLDSEFLRTRLADLARTRRVGPGPREPERFGPQKRRQNCAEYDEEDRRGQKRSVVDENESRCQLNRSDHSERVRFGRALHRHAHQLVRRARDRDDDDHLERPLGPDEHEVEKDRDPDDRGRKARQRVAHEPALGGCGGRNRHGDLRLRHGQR